MHSPAGLKPPSSLDTQSRRPWRWPWSCDPRRLKPHNSTDARNHDPGFALGADSGGAILGGYSQIARSMLGATIQDLPLASALEIRSSMAKAPWVNRFSEPRCRPCPWRWPWSCECRWLKLHRSINARSHDPGIVLGAGFGNAKPLGVIDARGPLTLALELRSSMTAMKVALLPCFGVLSATCSDAEGRQRTSSAE